MIGIPYGTVNYNSLANWQQFQDPATGNDIWLATPTATVGANTYNAVNVTTGGWGNYAAGYQVIASNIQMA